MSVSVFNKVTGVLSQPQHLYGSTHLLASSDGSTLLTSVGVYDYDIQAFASQEYIFYRRSDLTGLYEQTARYDALSAGGRFSMAAQSMEEEGVYVGVYHAAQQSSLLFLPSTQAPAPITVYGTSSGIIELTSQGASVFASGSGIGLQLLAPRGGSPQQVGTSQDRPLGITGGKVFVSRYSGYFQQLLSVDLNTGAEESLVVQPRESTFQIHSLSNVPDGKTILSMSAASEFSIILTDGTAADTSIFPAMGPIPGPIFQTTGAMIPGTSRFVVSLSGKELWVWDLSDGTNHRLVDTNPFGSDWISQLVTLDGSLWFEGQIEGGLWGIFHTNGLQTTREFEHNSWIRFIPGADAMYIHGHGSLASLVPDYQNGLYRIDPRQPGPPAGPSNLGTTVVMMGNSTRLGIHWDAVDSVSFYEVAVRPWYENGDSSVFSNLSYDVKQTFSTDATFELSNGGRYGWQAVHVRGVTATGKTTKWAVSTFSLTEVPILPDDAQFFYYDGSLRVGFRDNRVHQNFQMQVRRSNDLSSGIRFDSPPYFLYELDTSNTPFSGSNYYFYRDFPILEDGDYTVDFYREYIDPNPDTLDLSLPRASRSLPLSIRNRSVIRSPEELKVAVLPAGVQFSWSGTLLTEEEGFEVWVNDIGRGGTRTIHQKVKSHSLLHDLPNGRYRGWVGLRNPSTGITRWSPGKEFVVASHAPRVVSPGTLSGIPRPAFQWTGNNSSAYEIWLTDLGTGRRLALEQVTGATQWTPSFDLPSGKYAFWVRELVNNTTKSPWSSRFVLTQQEPEVRVTSGLSPGLDQTPLLGWERRTGARSYELWIGQTGSSEPAYRRMGLTGTSHRVATPLGNGEFTVWVRADLGAGKVTAWGEGYRMVIGASVDLSVLGRTVSWNAVPSATYYELWINYDGGEREKQARIVHRETYFRTSYTLPATMPKGRYSVWVRAIRAEGGQRNYGVWSSPASMQLSANVTAESHDAILLTHLFTSIAREGLADTPGAIEPKYDQPGTGTDPSAVPVPTAAAAIPAETTGELVAELAGIHRI